jgi:hypothetical protein
VGQPSTADSAVLQYTRDLVGGPVDVVVYDHMIGEAAAERLLGRAHVEAAGDAGVVVAPPAQAPLQVLTGRGDDQDEN